MYILYITLNAYRLLMGKARKKETTRNTKTLVDNIKMDLRDIRWRDVNWTELIRCRHQWRALVNTVMNFLLP
jgi:hypothetical protein